MKVFRLIESPVAVSGAVSYLLESMHAAGSPMAQRIMIGREAGTETRIELVRRLLSLDDKEECP